LGTTLLRLMLCAHSQVSIPPEGDFLMEMEMARQEPPTPAQFLGLGFEQAMSAHHDAPAVAALDQRLGGHP